MAHDDTNATTTTQAQPELPQLPPLPMVAIETSSQGGYRVIVDEPADSAHISEPLRDLILRVLYEADCAQVAGSERSWVNAAVAIGKILGYTGDDGDSERGNDISTLVLIHDDHFIKQIGH